MDELLDLRQKMPKFEPQHWVWLVNDDGNGEHSVRSEEIGKGVSNLVRCTAEIFKLGKNVVESYIRIGVLLREIEVDQLYRYVHCKAQSYKNIYEFTWGVFGFSRSTTYALLDITKRFVIGESLAPAYQGYTYSQLRELLPVSEEEMPRYTSEMSVREIRELRTVWGKYGYNADCTWQEALQRGREREAAEVAEKKTEKKVGLLEMLNGGALSEAVAPSAPIPSPLSDPLIESYVPLSLPGAEKHTFKNDAERKTFLSEENVLKWPRWIEIPVLHLTFRRMNFLNGDYLVALFRKRYGFDSRTNRYDRLYDCMEFYLCTKEKPVFAESISVSYILDYLKEHKTEI